MTWYSEIQIKISLLEGRADVDARICLITYLFMVSYNPITFINELLSELKIVNDFNHGILVMRIRKAFTSD